MILQYSKSKHFGFISNVDANFVRCIIDRKGTLELTNQFIGHVLISYLELISSQVHWNLLLVSYSFKKQNSITLSIVEVKYVMIGTYCIQIIWIKNTLKNYGVCLKNILFNILNPNILTFDIISLKII